MWIADDALDGLLQALQDANARADRAEVERDTARRLVVALDGRFEAFKEGLFGPDYREHERRHMLAEQAKRERMLR